MKKLSLRLLTACVIAFPLCFYGYIALLIFAVPRLLGSGSAFPTYSGFYLQHPSLVGKASNLQCVNNNPNDASDGYSYYCRFNVNSSNIEQFIKEKKFVVRKFPEDCDSMNVAASGGYYSPEPQWSGPELEVGRVCYAATHNKYDNTSRTYLIYSPKNQLAYLKGTD
ncbi:hypothetical protein NDI44_27560 [Trichocoleus sp. DQ-A3]|uniref:hypothetical protein n=1 Tax=Cyanophyceae TaxID=3028117 RepID=UPI00168778BE|nr:hypothetical protein [Coleofasciculus sp. FACHB-125]MBD1903630.1 hypothetical protein [Coleofasciculus sp. FACHB-125]